MRRLLRRTINELRAAGLQIETIAQGGKHTEIRLRNGGVLRLSKGNHEIRFFEDRLRRDIRRLQGDVP